MNTLASEEAKTRQRLNSFRRHSAGGKYSKEKSNQLVRDQQKLEAIKRVRRHNKKFKRVTWLDEIDPTVSPYKVVLWRQGKKKTGVVSLLSSLDKLSAKYSNK